MNIEETTQAGVSAPAAATPASDAIHQPAFVPGATAFPVGYASELAEWRKSPFVFHGDFSGLTEVRGDPMRRLQILHDRGLDHAWNQVRQFHEDFGHPIATTPTMLTKERMLQRGKWSRSEIKEGEDAETLVDQADAMIDCIYFCLGSLVEMGLRPQPLMDIVHYKGNMSKKHLIDGEYVVVTNAEGKVVKPDGWVAPEPELEAEIERQRFAGRE